MNPEQLARMLDLAGKGWSARQIAAEEGMPSHTTIDKWLRRRREKELESQGVATPMSETMKGAMKGVATPPANPPREVSATTGVARFVPEDSPVVKLSLERSLVGMVLSPKDLLDAKEARVLPENAWLDPWGRVELRKGDPEPLWPAYEGTGRFTEKGHLPILQSLPPRPANRGRDNRV